MLQNAGSMHFILVFKDVDVAWQASLQLGFVMQGQRTVLKHRKHYGPLRVQKALWPEPTGVCHVIMVHPPAGIAGGDELSIQVDLAEGSHALLTTPGAGKWYGSAGQTARQHIRLSVADNALLEWLPQEAMLFNQAIADSQTSIHLSDSAAFIGWDMLVIGRQSRQEKFLQGSYHNQLNIFQNQQLIFQDQLYIEGDDLWLTSPLGMHGRAVMGALYLVPPPAQRQEEVLDAQIELLRELVMRMQMPLRMTRLGHTIVARYLGEDARQCIDGFAGLRAKCRKWWFGLDEELPRIWRT